MKMCSIGRLATARSRLPNLIRRFARDENGVVAVMLAMMLPVIMGMAAIGVDLGAWFADARSLRNATVLAAVAGGHELRRGNDNTYSLSNRVEQEAVRNGFDSGTGSMTVSWPPSTGTYAGDAYAIEVTATGQASTFFSRALLNYNPAIQSRSVAQISSESVACILALNPTADRAVEASGFGTVTMEGCVVASNSNAANFIYKGNNATIEADCATAVGDIYGELSVDCPAPLRSARPVDDPFEDLPSPTLPGGCAHNNLVINSGDTMNVSGGTRFCNGVRVNGGGALHLSPGTYYVDRGDFTVNGGATLTGTDVTIVLTSSTGANPATITINGGADVDLSAPDSGDYAGIAVFQDSDDYSSNVNKFNGGSSMTVKGALYFPEQSLEFENGLSGPECTVLVAQTITFTGTGTLNADCTDYWDDGIRVFDTVKVVE